MTQATNDKQRLAPVLERVQAVPDALGAVTAIAADAGYERALAIFTRRLGSEHEKTSAVKKTPAS